MEEIVKGPQEAKISIEVGDWKISMEGTIDTPVIESYTQRKDIWKMGPDIYKNVKFSIVPRTDILVEQVRWTIPIAIRPRIEK